MLHRGVGNIFGGFWHGVCAPSARLQLPVCISFALRLFLLVLGGVFMWFPTCKRSDSAAWGWWLLSVLPQGSPHRAGPEAGGAWADEGVSGDSCPGDTQGMEMTQRGESSFCLWSFVLRVVLSCSPISSVSITLTLCCGFSSEFSSRVILSPPSHGFSSSLSRGRAHTVQPLCRSAPSSAEPRAGSAAGMAGWLVSHTYRISIVIN